MEWDLGQDSEVEIGRPQWKWIVPQGMSIVHQKWIVHRTSSGSLNKSVGTLFVANGYSTNLVPETRV